MRTLSIGCVDEVVDDRSFVHVVKRSNTDHVLSRRLCHTRIVSVTTGIKNLVRKTISLQLCTHLWLTKFTQHERYPFAGFDAKSLSFSKTTLCANLKYLAQVVLKICSSVSQKFQVLRDLGHAPLGAISV